MLKINTHIIFIRIPILAAALLGWLNINAQNTTITINTSIIKNNINKNIYGHFAEHLGNGIYGGFYVGDTNTIISNIKGVRKDIIEALQQLKIPMLRWPGGCYADTYHWENGIGPKEQRPVTINKKWGGVKDDNNFGTNEFLNLCEILGAEPYISGNVGTGTPEELSDWMQYTNASGEGKMSNRRITNGREEPWKASLWGIGNEAWGCGGNMSAKKYALEYLRFLKVLTDSNHASGVMYIAAGAKDADYHWTRTLMKNIPLNQMDGISLHHYTENKWYHKGYATQFNEAQYFNTMKSALKMETLITNHSAIMDLYDPQKKVALVVDEWGAWYEVEPGTNLHFLYQQNTMRDAMIAGVTLNIFNNHSDRVRMACLAQCVNVLQAVILTKGVQMIRTPTYHVMEMFKVHQNAALLPIQVSTPDYIFRGKKLPAISLSASKDSLGTIHISIVNIHATKSQTVTINLEKGIYNSVVGRILSSHTLQQFNSFEEPAAIVPVKYNDFQLIKDKLTLTLPPFSIVVLALY